MIDLRKVLGGVLCVALVLAWGSAALAQDASADAAKAALQKGLDQYQTLKFQDAKASLLEADPAALTPADKQKRDDYLNKVDDAIKKQAAAQEAFDGAVKAKQNNQFDAAQAGFTTAASSEFLDAATRKTAQEQLALLKNRKPAVLAAVAAPGSTGLKPVPTAPAASAAPAAGNKMIGELEGQQAQARKLTAEAKAAFDSRQYERAAALYQQALDLAPNLEDAQLGLNAVRKATASSGGESIVSDMERKRLLARQAANVDIADALKRVDEILARAETTTEFEDALGRTAAADNVLQHNKDYYTESEYLDKKTVIDEKARFVRMRLDAWNHEQANAKRLEIAKADAERIRREETSRLSTIADLTSHAQTLMRERKYEEAIQNLDKILLLDPNNRWANEQKMLLENFQITRQEHEIESAIHLETAKTRVDLRDAETPWYDLLKYPKDWREITERREPFGASQASESDADRKVYQALKKNISELKFSGVEFKDVITYLQEVVTPNIAVNRDALAAAGIDMSKQVNVSLSNVTAERGIHTILDSVNATLDYSVEDGVITISTTDDLNSPKHFHTEVYDIRDLIYVVPNFTNSPRMDMSQLAGQIGGNNSGSSGIFQRAGGGGKAAELTPDDLLKKIKELIRNSVTATWADESGGGGPDASRIDDLHGQLVVKTTPAVQQKVLDLINKLREAKALQISIEARFLTVSTGFLNSVGIDLQSYFNIGSRLGAISPVSTGSLPNFVVDPVTGIRVPTGTSGPVIGTPGTGRYPGVPGNQDQSTWTQQGVHTGPSTQYLTPIAVTQNSFAFPNMATGDVTSGIQAGTSIGSEITSPAMSVAGTFLNDIQVDFLVQATQATQDSRILTAPRLTLFNGQRAYVSIATQQAYVADLSPVVADNAVAFSPTIGYIPSGSVLDVEATISADRRYVTMTVRPQICQLNSFGQYFIIVSSVNPATNAPIAGTGSIQLPNVTLQDLETTVSVPDGGTLLLGGQKATGQQEREMGVPLLDKIPVIDRLFSNRGIVRDEQTLLILIKPKIIIQREEEEKAFPPR